MELVVTTPLRNFGGIGHVWCSLSHCTKHASATLMVSFWISRYCISHLVSTSVPHRTLLMSTVVKYIVADLFEYLVQCLIRWHTRHVRWVLGLSTQFTWSLGVLSIAICDDTLVVLSGAPCLVHTKHVDATLKNYRALSHLLLYPMKHQIRLMLLQTLFFPKAQGNYTSLYI